MILNFIIMLDTLNTHLVVNKSRKQKICYADND